MKGSELGNNSLRREIFENVSRCRGNARIETDQQALAESKMHK
jgi:hypothetical protein